MLLAAKSPASSIFKERDDAPGAGGSLSEYMATWKHSKIMSPCREPAAAANPPSLPGETG
jgi:hypothetical protein